MDQALAIFAMAFVTGALAGFVVGVVYTCWRIEVGIRKRFR